MEAAAKRKNIPIQVDCVCSTRGKLTPRWFRYEDEEHQIQIVYIKEILGEKELNYVASINGAFSSCWGRCRGIWDRRRFFILM